MKQTLIGLGIIMLIILGYWYYSSSLMPTSNSTVATTTAATSTTALPAAATKTATKPRITTPQTSNTFHSIFSQSGSHMCSISQVTSSSQNNNTIYIADGKMRAEFHTVGGPANIMLYDGGYLYTWKEGTTAGTRTTIHTVSDLPQAIPRDLTSGTVIGTNLNSVGWDCHDWIKNNSLLTVPSYVHFQ